ncbi:MAG: hypothetical protein ACO3B4_06230 [Burkholderiaceae bacterium]
MAFSKFLKPWISSDTAARGPRPRAAADSLADAIGLELKGIVSQAVLDTLEDRESHYLTAILEKSIFLIESVVITPQDKGAASSLEKFLRLHTEIDPGFRTQFFHSILEKEYRSARGASALISPQMQPSVQFNEASLETPSTEEAFQISLRGRRVSYTAAVTLTGPVARTSAQAQAAQKARQQAEQLAEQQAGQQAEGRAAAKMADAELADEDRGEPFLRTAAGQAARANKESAAEGRTAKPGAQSETIVLKIHDAQGERIVHSQSPVLLGRESPSERELGALQFVPVMGTYVSRRHLVIVSVAEDTYFFLHDAATLSCQTSTGQLLRPGSLYSLARNAEAQLIFGVTTDARSVSPDTGRAAEFPIIEISRLRGEHPGPSQATPRPTRV